MEVQVEYIKSQTMPQSGKDLFEHLAVAYFLLLSTYCTTLALIQDFKWAPAWRRAATLSKTLRIWLLLSKNNVLCPLHLLATSGADSKCSHSQNMIATFLFIVSPRLIAALCEPFLFTFLTFFNLSNWYISVFQSWLSVYIPLQGSALSNIHDQNTSSPPRPLAHSSCTKLLRKPRQWPNRRESVNEYCTKKKDVCIIYALKCLLSSTNLICVESVFLSATIPK